METPEVVYLESSIFIAAACYPDEIGETARKIILMRPLLVTSNASFAEALRGITRRSGKEQAIWACERFAKLPNLSILAENLQVTAQMIENYKNTNLTPLLAMHLAYMQINSITHIASLDSAFDKVKGIKRVKP